MRFHLIDRITDYTSWKVAKGFKNITKSDELISNNKDKRIKYSNNLLCESVFQTLAWLIVKSSQQTKRPVILSIEESGTIVSYLQKKQRICRCFFAWLR